MQTICWSRDRSAPPDRWWLHQIPTAGGHCRSLWGQVFFLCRFESIVSTIAAGRKLNADHWDWFACRQAISVHSFGSRGILTYNSNPELLKRKQLSKAVRVSDNTTASHRSYKGYTTRSEPLKDTPPSRKATHSSIHRETPRGCRVWIEWPHLVPCSPKICCHRSWTFQRSDQTDQSRWWVVLPSVCSTGSASRKVLASSLGQGERRKPRELLLSLYSYLEVCVSMEI